MSAPLPVAFFRMDIYVEDGSHHCRAPRFIPFILNCLVRLVHITFYIHLHLHLHLPSSYLLYSSFFKSVILSLTRNHGVACCSSNFAIFGMEYLHGEGVLQVSGFLMHILLMTTKMINKTWCRWPVTVGIIAAAVIILFAVCYGIRYCCCRRRRQRGRRYSNQSPPHASSQAYQSKPPSYESPRLMPYDARQMSKGKDDPLPPIPSWETLSKNGLDEDREQGMELGSLEPLPAQNVTVSTLQPNHPAAAGLIPLQISPSMNSFESSTHSHNPFLASNLGENRDYKPISPLSPQRSYSPFSPSNYTRYTTSPFNDPPSRQPSPFSSASSMRTLSYVPPHPPYAAYSSTTMTLQSPSLLDEPKSPYRAYSPRLSPRYRFSANPPPSVVADAPSEVARHETTSLNPEPLELSTPYNIRPQSMSLDQLARREAQGQSTRMVGGALDEDHGQVSHNVQEQQPIQSAPNVPSPQPRNLGMSTLPYELASRHSTQGVTLSIPPSVNPSEPVQPQTDDSTRTKPDPNPSTNPFRNP